MVVGTEDRANIRVLKSLKGGGLLFAHELAVCTASGLICPLIFGVPLG